jgi:hypothetical protein
MLIYTHKQGHADSAISRTFALSYFHSLRYAQISVNSIDNIKRNHHRYAYTVSISDIVTCNA